MPFIVRRRNRRFGSRSNELPQKTKQAIGTERIIGDFFRFYMLMLLYESPKSGYELMNDIGSRLGKRVSPSIVYPFLKTLEGRRIIAPKSMNTGERERIVNTLTPQGRNLCRRLFSQFTDKVSTAIEPSMQACSNCGSRVFRGTYYWKMARAGKALPFCCIHCAADFRRKNKRARRIRRVR